MKTADQLIGTAQQRRVVDQDSGRLCWSTNRHGTCSGSSSGSASLQAGEGILGWVQAATGIQCPYRQ